MTERIASPKLCASALLLVSILATQPCGAFINDAQAQPVADGSELAHSDQISANLTAPLPIRDQHPLALLHLSVLPQSASVMGAGSTDLFASLSVSNTLNRERGDFLIDAETRVLEGGVRHAVSPSLELSLQGDVIYRGGGETDQPIEEWHSLFGLPNGQRKRVPQNGYAIEGTNRDGSKFSLQRQGIGIGDLVVGAKQRLWQDTSQAQTVSVAVRSAVPTGANSFGQDAIDFASDLIGECQLSANLTLHAGVGYLFFGDIEEEGIHYRRHHGNGFLAAAYRATPSVALLLQVVGASALLEDLPRYPDFSSYLDVAIRYSAPGVGEATLLLRENPSPDKSTTDVTLLAEIRLPIFSR